MSEFVPFIRIEKGELVRILCDESKESLLINDGWLKQPYELPKKNESGKLVPMYRGLRYDFTKCFVSESQKDLLAGWVSTFDQLPAHIEKAKPGPKPKLKVEDESVGSDS